MSACTDALDAHFGGVALIEPAYLLESYSEGHVLNVFHIGVLIHSLDVFASHGCTIDTAVCTPSHDAGLLLLNQDGTYFTAKYLAGVVGALQAIDADLPGYITQTFARCLLSDDGEKLVLLNQNFE